LLDQSYYMYIKLDTIVKNIIFAVHWSFGVII
jgi:hypothetical protein